MIVKTKKVNKGATLPLYSTSGAACFDLHACLDESITMFSGASAIIPTGLSFEIPEGSVMLVFSRSGHAFNQDIRLGNSVGVIDSDFRGEVKVKLRRDSSLPPTKSFTVTNGDRIAQALILPVEQVEFRVVEELSKTLRGEIGFGSTGV